MKSKTQRSIDDNHDVAFQIAIPMTSQEPNFQKSKKIKNLPYQNTSHRDLLQRWLPTPTSVRRIHFTRSDAGSGFVLAHRRFVTRNSKFAPRGLTILSQIREREGEGERWKFRMW